MTKETRIHNTKNKRRAGSIQNQKINVTFQDIYQIRLNFTFIRIIAFFSNSKYSLGLK